MDANGRSKRDLPEVVAEILIEQHAMREEIGGMRQEMREGQARMEQLFNNMTTAILEAMDRQTAHCGEVKTDVDDLKTRVTKLENPGAAA
ncbi:hypothetical protein Q5H93_04585 [Hymenobacter sp. ASUV-10]|uniref:Uncharacterized protein n=1 Tax=Hymenobacter aranciens TaxID=3063996 RepID=A0ABT9BBC2_9BACT|nr:hypothetical protein [Hymenobacter sp. ASUV-10]MDO7874001.1 hypothetical protein [Hymenobacter sp. ASUV-10]